LSTNEYSDLFSDWMMSKSIGSDYENYGTDDESRYNDNNEDYED